MCLDDGTYDTVMALNSHKWNEITPITKLLYNEISPYIYITVSWAVTANFCLKVSLGLSWK